MADEYCSTPARALALVLPPPGREKTALWAERDRRAPTARGSPSASARCSRRLPRSDRRRHRRAAAAGGARARAHRAARAAGARRAPHRRRRARAAAADRRDQAGASPPTSPGGRPHLLHGVTGSGKTEVYLRAAARALERGEGVIVLVPEIALTPQIVARFPARFGDTVARAALRARRGRALRRVAAAAHRRGADLRRPALGRVRAGRAPRRWSSSTRSTTPPTSTRATRATTPACVAERARAGRRALLVAARATPRAGDLRTRCARLRLPERVDGRAAAARRVLDMRGARRHRCTRATRHALRRRAQVDRAAQPPRLVELPDLPDAAGRLGVPALRRRARPAPRRGRARLPPLRPPRARARALRRCGSLVVARHGAGTERLEHELRGAGRAGLPPRRRHRSDAGRGARALPARADRGVLRRHADGRQGPRLPRRRRSASCSTPTRRCASRTSAPRSARSRWSPSSPGRAGRGTDGGRVLVQTIAPDAPRDRGSPPATTPTASSPASSRRREALRYPPFADLIRVVCCVRAAGRRARGGRRDRGARALGPGALGPAPLFRLRGRERCQVVVKARERRAAIARGRRGRRGRRRRSRAPRRRRLSVDVDPQ